MPRYDFECRTCGYCEEIICKVGELPSSLPCPTCHVGEMRQNIGCAILRDEPTWLPSARETLQVEDEKPIESRHEYKKYLKTHNIVERS